MGKQIFLPVLIMLHNNTSAVTDFLQNWSYVGSMGHIFMSAIQANLHHKVIPVCLSSLCDMVSCIFGCIPISVQSVT